MNVKDNGKEIDGSATETGNGLIGWLKWLFKEPPSNQLNEKNLERESNKTDSDKSFIQEATEVIDQVFGDEDPDHNKNSEVPKPSPITKLEPIVMWSNWKVRNQDLPHYTIPGQAGIFDALLNEIISRSQNVQLKSSSKRTIGWAWDSDSEAKGSRTLRIVDKIEEAHKVATDVTLSSRGGDLYVKLEALAWSKIQVLRKALALVAFVAVFLGVLTILITYGNLINNWVKAVATAHAPKDGFSVSRREGDYDSASDNFSNAQALESLIIYGNRPSLDEQKLLFVQVLTDKGQNGQSLAEKNQKFFEKMFLDSCSTAEKLKGEFTNRYKKREEEVKNEFQNSPYQIMQVAGATAEETFKKFGTWDALIGTSGGLEEIHPDSLEKMKKNAETLQGKINYICSIAKLESEFIATNRFPLVPPNGTIDPRLKSCRTYQDFGYGFSKIYKDLPPDVSRYIFLRRISDFESPIDVLKLCQTTGQTRLIRLLEKYKKFHPTYGDPLQPDFPFIFALIRSDALKALEMLKYPAIVAGSMAAGIMFMPLGMLGIPCRFVGLPKPSDFENDVTAQSAGIEALLGQILLDMGVTQENLNERRQKR